MPLKKDKLTSPDDDNGWYKKGIKNSQTSDKTHPGNRANNNNKSSVRCPEKYWLSCLNHKTVNSLILTLVTKIQIRERKPPPSWKIIMFKHTSKGKKNPRTASIFKFIQQTVSC